MDQDGDAKIIDLLHTLADCPKARSAIFHDRCKRSTNTGCHRLFGAQRQKNGSREQCPAGVSG
jgi:hypothetical protein